MTSNTTSSYYNTTSSSYLFAVDWSPNDKMIAFSISSNKTIILDANTKSVISEFSFPDGVW